MAKKILITKNEEIDKSELTERELGIYEAGHEAGRIAGLFVMLGAAIFGIILYMILNH